MLRRVAVAEDVNDVVAECFLILWRRLSVAPSEDGDVLPWLIGVARRVLANDRRARMRREQLFLRLADLHVETGVDEDDEPARRQIQLVIDALFRLSREDREIVLLAAWEELSTHEIAVALCCSDNAAAVRLHRARRRLERVVRAHEDKPTGLAIR